VHKQLSFVAICHLALSMQAGPCPQGYNQDQIRCSYSESHPPIYPRNSSHNPCSVRQFRYQQGFALLFPQFLENLRAPHGLATWVAVALEPHVWANASDQGIKNCLNSGGWVSVPNQCSWALNGTVHGGRTV
jgi:hypothetical protein